MRVMVAGSGGRERALAWRLSSSPSLSHLLATGDLPGWPERAEIVEARTAREIARAAHARRVDLVVVGPEVLLAEGLADELDEIGIPCFGPSREAARLESSKAYAKDVIRAAGVPTAEALLVHLSSPDELRAGLARCERGRVVLKADGLASGKGVLVCPSPEEAVEGLHAMQRFGSAAETLLLEDLLVGPEVSVFALCDGERAVALPSARDHKRLLEGDRGPNTGGMGAISPSPDVDRERASALVEQIHAPVLREMSRRGAPFRGVLYAGLMMTEQGPMVLEFNVRFGDPECQPLMMLWADDPIPWLYGAATGRLPQGSPRFLDEAACCVVLAADGYPDSPVRGTPIPEPEPAADPRVVVFHAGTTRAPDGHLQTAGGRVLSVTATGTDPRDARTRAYREIDRWRFPGARYRTDIGGAV